jgi:hypothetical protein
MRNSDYQVQLRGGFSDRNSLKQENNEIQLISFDERTRTSLINATNFMYKLRFDKYAESKLQFIYKRILSEAYVTEVDWRTSYDGGKVFMIVCNTIRSDKYDSVLTVIEYLAKLFDEEYEGYSAVSAKNVYNSVFEKEYVGYRFVGYVLTQISDKAEILEINETLSSPYSEVKQHMEKAITLLSDRTTPDYANSIKESISAVERMCSIIIGNSTTLGAALDKLEKKGLIIHPAMKTAFDKLYGYTCDGSGIRHSGQLGGAESTFEEAKFMLVSCCAFINYLVGVLSKLL